MWQNINICEFSNRLTFIQFHCLTDCGHPSIRDNTTFIYNSTTYGSRLRVTCDEGFNLTGSAKSKCLASGSWSKIARCDRKRKFFFTNIHGNYHFSQPS